MSFVKSSVTIGIYTLISRVLGFVRDITIAWGLGAGFLSDAFFVAFKLPNFLRRLFAEGAFNAAFIPLYSGKIAADGQDQATRFASEAMSLLLIILLAVTALFIIFMPWLMYILAPGFSDDPDKFDLTVTLTRITMPYIIFISLVSLLGGILNSAQKFAAVAATPIFMNLALIIVPSLVDEWTATAAHALAIAVFIAGLVQLLWLYVVCARQGLVPQLRKPALTEDVKKLLILIGPAALGAGVAQINLFIDLIIASQFDGGVSYLYYADRINELPLAIIGIAAGTALLPMLSRQIRSNDLEAAYNTQNKAIGFTLFLSIPAAVALMIIAEPVIRIMFERGAFGAAETAATVPALVAFAAGLPAFVMIKIFAPCFYAYQDTKTPFKIAASCIVVNLLLNLALMNHFQHVGMAMATSISGWINVAFMVVILKRRDWLRIERGLLLNIAKILCSCVLMVVVLQAAEEIFVSWLNGQLFQRFSALIIVACCGAAVYFIASYLLNTLAIRPTIHQTLNRKIRKD